MKNWTLPLLAGVAAAALITPTLAADLIVDPPAPVPDMAASGDWEGAYAGIFGGYGSAAVDHTGPGLPAPSPFGPDGADFGLSGFLLGVTAGANFYLTDGVVAGVVGDLAWSNISGEEFFNPPGPAFDGDISHVINWQGSIRGRVGFDAGSVLPYLTAGIAFASATREADFNGFGPASATHIGWTAGAGVEIAVSENMTVDLLYRYTDYGEQTYDFGAAPNNPVVGITAHTVTAGLNFSF